MDDPICDGKPHILNENFGYITKMFKEDKSFLEVQTEKNKMLKEYVLYLMENKCPDMLELIMKYLILDSSDNFSYIYRPSYLSSCLAQYAHMSIKFKRVEDDNLNEKN